MKARIARLFIRAAIAAAVVVAGNTAFGAQCPASPSYSPDFTLNESCLALNGTLNTVANTAYPAFVAPGEGPTVLRLTPNQGGWAASAWYNIQQPVASGFSTTFTFQLSGASEPPADGFAFLIQNSALTALSPGGCGVGFGDDQTYGSCAPTTGGIPNSLAVEFKTFDNGEGYPNHANSVAILTNGTGANCIDSSCAIFFDESDSVDNSLLVTLADGAVHMVTISYTLESSSSNCTVNFNPGPCMDVILDGNDLFPNGVPVNLSNLLTLKGGNAAWVGFTAGTGALYENHDILSWTFESSQSGVVNPGAGSPTVFNFEGGFTPNSPTSGYDYTVQLGAGQPPEQVVVTAIPQASQGACNTIVQASFPGAECFVVKNGGGLGVDVPVMFEVTCPGSPTGGTCGSDTDRIFFATLGTDFAFDCGENSPLGCGPPPAYFTFGFPNLTPSNGLPEVGFLKGVGPDPLHPCTQNPSNTPPLFQSNQISAFTYIDGQAGASPVKSMSGGTGSCWVVTYLTGDELPTATIAQPANGGVYEQGQVTQANYTCTAVNNGNASATGPYLTVASCSATDSPGGSVADGGQFDTKTLGSHTFTASVEDSATNTASQTVTYNVVQGANLTRNQACSGISGTYKGNVTVSQNQTCTLNNGGITGNLTQTGGTMTLANSSFVNGNLQASGGSLTVSNSTVGGDLQINGPVTFTIGPGIGIRGNLQIQSLPASGGTDQVCGAFVDGDLTFQNNGTAVLIGASGCPGNMVGGNLTVQNNTASTTIDSNVVGGNLTDQSNTAATQVFTNAVTKNLQCNGNISINGGGNTAASKKGQCATF